jgi:hypothetical protein
MKVGADDKLVDSGPPSKRLQVLDPSPGAVDSVLDADGAQRIEAIPPNP